MADQPREDDITKDPAYQQAMARLDAGEDPDNVLAGKPAPENKGEGDATTGAGEGTQDQGEGAQKGEQPQPEGGEQPEGDAAGGTGTADGEGEGDREPAAAPAGTETVDELHAQLEQTQRALEDTKRWGHQNAGEVKKLRKGLEALDRKVRQATRERPDILEREPELAEAIRYTLGLQEGEEPGGAPEGSRAGETQPGMSRDEWAEAVEEVHPDADRLLSVPAIKDHMQKAASHYGEAWSERPTLAIRELNYVKEQLALNRTRQATEAAVAAHKEKEKKRRAQTLPGGGQGPAPAASKTEADEVRRIETMSSEDFEKERQKVLGGVT